MPGRRSYWICSCGGWTDAAYSVDACYFCGRKPDSATAAWLQRIEVSPKEAKARTRKKDTKDKSASAGDASAPSAGAAASAAAGTASVPPGVTNRSAAVSHPAPMDSDEGAVVVEIPDDTLETDAGSLPLADRVQAAQQEVADLEALGPAGRRAIPDFVNLLAAARLQREDLREDLVKERRASRPTRWRLVAAESEANLRATAVERTKEELAALVLERSKIMESIDAKTIELEQAEEALSGAQSAVAMVRAEIARDVDPSLPQALLDTVQGLLVQLARLPAAFAGNNGMDAFQAIGTQAEAVSRAMGLEPIETHLPPQASPGVAPNLASQPAGRCASGRRGTSPEHDSSADSNSEPGSERSRSRERRALASAAVGTHPLEELGFHRHATADPYPAGLDAEDQTAPEGMAQPTACG